LTMKVTFGCSSAQACHILRMREVGRRTWSTAPILRSTL
jgi:hypothetical protein